MEETQMRLTKWKKPHLKRLRCYVILSVWHSGKGRITETGKKTSGCQALAGGRDELAERRGRLRQWKCSAWRLNDGNMVLIHWKEIYRPWRLGNWLVACGNWKVNIKKLDWVCWPCTWKGASSQKINPKTKLYFVNFKMPCNWKVSFSSKTCTHKTHCYCCELKFPRRAIS